MQKRGKTALTLVGFAAMLAALLALMVSVGAKKDGFDIDEFFTYGLANSYHQPFLSHSPQKKTQGYKNAQPSHLHCKYLTYFSCSLHSQKNSYRFIYDIPKRHKQRKCS